MRDFLGLAREYNEMRDFLGLATNAGLSRLTFGCFLVPLSVVVVVGHFLIFPSFVFCF